MYIYILLLIIFSCSSDKQNREKESARDNRPVHYIDDSTSTDDGDDENMEESENSDDCKFDDGSYSATVDYYNPETGYSQTYTLEVDVEDCQVIQINFPKGGWLDEDHISPAEIDEEGNASIDGENGKTYEVHLDE